MPKLLFTDQNLQQCSIHWRRCCTLWQYHEI